MADGKKDFSDLDLDLDGLEAEAGPNPNNGKPRNLKEHHRAVKRTERGPLKNQTYTLAESVIDELRKYVLLRKLDGEKINASRVVEEALKSYLAESK